jgi:Bacterial protein of unknown function (DUF924)
MIAAIPDDHWVGEILHFWFVEIAREAWFSQDDAFDRRLGERFLGRHEQIARLPIADCLRHAEAAVAAVTVVVSHILDSLATLRQPDAHERGKNFLNGIEAEKLLQAAKLTRCGRSSHGIARGVLSQGSSREGEEAGSCARNPQRRKTRVPRNL